MSHTNTLFSQTLALIPRHVFQKLAKRHQEGRSSRKFGFKEQFTAMAFIQLAKRQSMRDALRCLESMPSRLYHWGLQKVSRSTFARANSSRPVGFFEDLFGEMYSLCTPQAPKHKFKLKSKLYSLDASTIKLCLSLFPWAKYRKAKGGVKLHVLHDHNGYIPAFASITDAKTHENRVAKAMELPKGSMVAFDKGYIDYSWFKLLGQKSIHFVTRLKRNAKYRLIERQKVDKKSGVTSDHVIEVTVKKGETLCLRRVGYRDPESKKHYEFLTNNFTLDAKVIADIYKERWQIEIFFREIKQNLRITSFVGNSENAVLIQIYTALTVYLLLAYQKFLNKSGYSIQRICQLFQCNLLAETSLEELLNPRKQKTKDNYKFSLLEA